MFEPLLLPQCGGLIRAHRDDDLDLLVLQAGNPKIPRYLMDVFPKNYSVANGMAWLEQSKAKPAIEGLAIELDGKYAGEITCRRQADVHRLVGSIGYWLGEEHWGRGVMTEAVRVFADYLFNSEDFLRLEACVYAPNKASARVLEKAGFSLEAVRRDAVIKEGVVMDDLLYARLRGD